MARTYMDIVNVVLRDINEVPLTTGNFDLARGLQAFVKESVNRALMDIINYNDEWPWLMNIPLTSASPATDTFNTVEGQAEYQIIRTEDDGQGGTVEVNVDNIDWDTITYIATNDTDSVRRPLEHVSYDFVANALEESPGRPRYVYRPMNDTHMGFYPPPDAVFKIDYITWKDPVLLSAATDEIPFDERWYTVVVSRARYYAWLFRENLQQAQMADREYQRNLNQMYKKYMTPNQRTMRAT